MANPTAPADVTKQLQYYPEGTYGVLEDAAFTSAGVVMNVSSDVTVDHESIRVQGSRLQYADIMMGIEGTLSVDYSPINTTLIKYGTDDPNGAGTIAESLCFLQARKLDDVENFRLFTGGLTESITIALERVTRITQNFYVIDTSDWMTLAGLKTALGVTGTDTPQFATPVTAEPWTHLTGSAGNATSIEINGQPVDVARASISVNNNIMKQKPLGHFRTKFARAGNKDITLTVEPFLYDNTLIDLVQGFTSVQVVATLNDATNKTVTLEGVKFNSHSDSVDAGANDFNTMPLNATANQIVVTA